MELRICLFLTLLSLYELVAADIQCMECVDQPDPFHCRTVTTCGSHEKCVLEQVVTSGGLILYNQGCRSIERCGSSSGKRNLISRQNPVSKSDIITCEECCDGDYCNLQGCGQTMKMQPDRGPICYNCDAQAAPDTCRDVTLCDLGQVCTLMKTTPYETSFTSKCARNMQCDHISKRDLVNACPVCCEDDFCNNNCTHNATLTTPTASSSTPTTSPPKTSSSTTVPYINTATMVPTVHTSQTTQYPPVRTSTIQCMECVDQPDPFHCRTVTTCSSHEKCVVEQVVTSGGLVLYNQGCRSIERCSSGSGKRNIVSRQNPVSTSDIITCEECCDGDYCNLQGCGQTMKLQPDRGPICYNCDAQAAPDTCRDVTLCDIGQVCALIKTTPFDTIFTSKCVSHTQCDHISKRDLVKACPVCCKDDFCNNNCTHNATATTTSGSSTLPTTTPLKTSSTTTILVPTHPTSPTTISIPTHTTSIVPPTESSTIASSTSTPTSSSTIKVTSNAASSIITSTSMPNTAVPSSTTSTIAAAKTTSTTSSTTHLTTVPYINTDTVVPTVQTSHTTQSTSTPVTTTMAPIVSSTPMSDCSQAIDICFVLDSSGSEGTTNFHQQLVFVNSIANQLAWSGNNHVQACVVTFSTQVETDIMLKTYLHAANFMDGVLKIPYRDGETRTDRGISRGTFELTHNFHHGARRDSSKVMIVVTDGHSTEPEYTLHSSQIAHSVGIHTFAVGVGSDINMAELQEIASDVSSTFRVDNFHDLKSVSQPIVNQLAKICHGINITVSSDPLSINPTRSPNSTITPITQDCYSESDICFLLDSSGSEGPDNFHKELLFINQIVNRFHFHGHAATQVCVITYATGSHMDVALNQFHDNTSLMNHILNITYRTGESRTDLGINRAMFELTTDYHGGERRGANKILVVLTDGHSSDPVRLEYAANTARRAGIHTFAIGVGNDVNQNELLLIGSDSGHVFNADNFDHLQTLQHTVFGHLKPICTQTTTSTTTTTTTTTPVPTTKSHTLPGCGWRKADIVFALDSTNSEGQSHFHNVVNFMYQFASKFALGPHDVQISSISFGSHTRHDFYLNTYSTRQAILHAIQSISYLGGGTTQTGMALSQIRHTYLSATHGARYYAEKIVIVITDGRSQELTQTQTQAHLLQNEAYTRAIAIGIGPHANNVELNQIASQHQVLTVPDFSSLHSILAKLIHMACNY